LQHSFNIRNKTLFAVMVSAIKKPAPRKGAAFLFASSPVQNVNTNVLKGVAGTGFDKGVAWRKERLYQIRIVVIVSGHQHHYWDQRTMV
jgi:hypothetical protein